MMAVVKGIRVNDLPLSQAGLEVEKAESYPKSHYFRACKVYILRKRITHWKLPVPLRYPPHHKELAREFWQTSYMASSRMKWRLHKIEGNSIFSSLAGGFSPDGRGLT